MRPSYRRRCRSDPLDRRPPGTRNPYRLPRQIFSRGPGRHRRVRLPRGDPHRVMTVDFPPSRGGAGGGYRAEANQRTVERANVSDAAEQTGEVQRLLKGENRVFRGPPSLRLAPTVEAQYFPARCDCPRAQPGLPAAHRCHGGHLRPGDLGLAIHGVDNFRATTGWSIRAIQAVPHRWLDTTIACAPWSTA